MPSFNSLRGRSRIPLLVLGKITYVLPFVLNTVQLLHLKPYWQCAASRLGRYQFSSSLGKMTFLIVVRIQIVLTSFEITLVIL